MFAFAVVRLTKRALDAAYSVAQIVKSKQKLFKVGARSAGRRASNASRCRGIITKIRTSGKHKKE